MIETYLSVCDGIGGATEALNPLGWKPAMLSEIEPWPRALLEQRHDAVDMARWTIDASGVPLWGDFSAIRVRHLLRFGVALPTMLIGGTPCQAFSVAGLRKSLDDARGNLTLSFVKLANAIDNARSVRGLPPIVIVWENVPGVLSTADNAFGCFLGALVGADTPLVPGRKQRWTNAGLVAGPRRKAAWAIKDAQFFGVAQRRRRVFVVASAREGFDPSEVFLERDCLPGNPAPSRETGQRPAGPAEVGAGGVGAEDGGITHDIAPALTAGGRGVERTGETRGQDPVVAVYLGNAEGGAPDLPFLTTSNLGKTVNNQTPLVSDQAPTVYPINADALRGEGTAKTPSADAEGRVRLRDPGFGVGGEDDPAGTLAAAGPGAVAIAYNLSPGAGSDGVPSAVEADVAHALTAVGEAEKNGRGLHVVDVLPFDTTQVTSVANHSSPQWGDPCHPVAATGNPPAIAFKPSHYTRGKDGAPSEVYPALSADADKGDQDPVVLAFSSKDHGQDIGEDLSPTLRAMPGDHANAGGQVAVAFALRGREAGAVPEIEGEGDTVGTLRAADGGSSRDYVAFALQAGSVRQNVDAGPDGAGFKEEVAYTLEARAEVQMTAWSIMPMNSCKDYKAREVEVAQPLMAGGPSVGNQGGDFIQHTAAVRRLTPVECERLRGYRDGYTMISWKGKPPEECPDGPRYRALGNSWAVPCVRWIGYRIQAESNRIGEAGLRPGTLYGRNGRSSYRLAA